MPQVILVIACLLAMSFNRGCGRRNAAPPVAIVVRVAPAEPLEARRLQTGPAYIASIRGDKETGLSFKIGGIIELIGPRSGEDWKEGTTVLQGAVLARLVQAEFVSTTDAARARAELDRKSFERATKLLGERAISLQESDEVKAHVQASEAGLTQAEQTLKESVIRAPFSGTILARNAAAGETIAPGTTVLRFADLQQMSVELGVPDSVVSRVQPGQDVQFAISALEGESFVGKVSEVGVAAKEGTRLFKVVIKIPNPDGRIKSGMTASVPFSEGFTCPPGAMLTPLSALVTDNAGRLAVFVVGADMRARLRTVKTDDIVGSSVIVTEGLKQGERVVVSGAGLLYEGAWVEARD